MACAERASTQGLADLLRGLMGALGSTAGGMILDVWGFAILNAVGGVLILGPLAVSLLGRPALASLSATKADPLPPSASGERGPCHKS
jgi:hypothetical protein